MIRKPVQPLSTSARNPKHINMKNHRVLRTCEVEKIQKFPAPTIEAQTNMHAAIAAF